MFTVFNLEQGLSILRDIRENDRRNVVILSPPQAACSMGIPWWMTLMNRLRTEAPSSIELVDILDCGNQAARAISALGSNQKHIVFDPASPQNQAVIMFARSLGATVLPLRPENPAWQHLVSAP
ncbi:hypothetical protein [Acetobacter sp.]|uniref:hypothetical protein n=1 Tax=Acetobacter sp. TaxID=440 RepID=UPI0039E81F46